MSSFEKESKELEDLIALREQQQELLQALQVVSDLVRAQNNTLITTMTLMSAPPMLCLRLKSKE